MGQSLAYDVGRLWGGYWFARRLLGIETEEFGVGQNHLQTQSDGLRAEGRWQAQNVSPDIASQDQTPFLDIFQAEAYQTCRDCVSVTLTQK